MRPVDKGSVDIPKNWHINSTPGGCLLDFAVQLAECEVPREVTPKFIVIAAGTNGMALSAWKAG